MSNRIEYIDTLKFIAIFAVISIHCFEITKGAEILNFEISSFQQIFRFAVPLFLLITGALFLNKEIKLDKFFYKRFKRIALPLIFFTTLLYITGLSDHVLYYYWYTWMIIGTLLAIPIINKFICYSNESEIKYYLIIFIIFSIFKQICYLFKIKYALDISFFYTPISYLILGYYLYKKNFSNNKILVFLFILSTFLKLKTGNYYYSNEFHTYLDLSLFEIIQVSSVFLIIKNIYENKTGIVYKLLNQKTIKKYILSISRSSYGMYLVQHPIIIQIIPPFFKKLNLTGSQTLMSVLLLILSVFVISWIMTIILSRIPFLNKFSGYY